MSADDPTLFPGAPDGIDRRQPPAPVPVSVVSPTPIPVEVTNGRAAVGRFAIQTQATDPSLPATTTFQQDLTTAGQRHINVMWEGTQKNIALLVTAFTLAVCAYCVVYPGVPTELRLLAFTLMSNVFFSVIVTYFQRTNHTKTGGVAAGEIGR